MMPSPWVTRWAARLPKEATVLDLACGAGRHAAWLARRGHAVTALDRDLGLAAALRRLPGIEWLQADLEAAPWPLAGYCFQAIVVTNYLHRPLFEPLIDALAPGGLLIYETFSLGQARYGRPRNPVHLLLPGELLELVRGRLRVLAYEDVEEPEQRRCVQRLCAQKP